MKSPLPKVCRVPPSMPVPARLVPVRVGATSVPPVNSVADPSIT